MAEVYEAVRPGSDKPKAVKVLRRELAGDKSQRKALKQEYDILAQCRHAGIPQVHDFDAVDGSAAILMSFCPGKTLRQLADRSVHLIG